MSESARIVTQNLWGRRGDWEARREVFREALAELRPDLVALPESVVNGDYDQVRDVLGDRFHVAHQRDREPGDGVDVEPGQGHSLASRWPLGEVRELDLHLTPGTEGFACGVIAAKVLAPEPLGPLVFAFHNPSWKLHQAYERELQAVAAARFLGERAFLDRAAGARRHERLLPRRLGEHPSRRAGRHVHAGEPDHDRARLAVSPDRLRLRPLRRARGADAGDHVVRAALRRAREEHADVILPGAEVRAVPVEADQVAGLRIQGDGQVVAAGARVGDEGRHVLVVAPANERLRAGLDVRLRDRSRAPGDVAAAPPGIDLRDMVRPGRLLREADELPHVRQRLFPQRLRFGRLLPLRDPLLLRG